MAHHLVFSCVKCNRPFWFYLTLSLVNWETSTGTCENDHYYHSSQLKYFHMNLCRESIMLKKCHYDLCGWVFVTSNHPLVSTVKNLLKNHIHIMTNAMHEGMFSCTCAFSIHQQTGTAFLSVTVTVRQALHSVLWTFLRLSKLLVIIHKGCSSVPGCVFKHVLNLIIEKEASHRL